MKSLGERVKTRRLQLGLTQIQLATKVTEAGFPVGQSAISAIENKGDTNPQCIFELATALEVTVDWLESGTELPSNSTGAQILPAGDGPTGTFEFGTRKSSLPRMKAVPSLPRDVPVLTLSPPNRTIFGESLPEKAKPRDLAAGWITTQITGYASRTAAIAHRNDIFCTFYTGYDLVPWRERGEAVYVDQRRAPHVGGHAFIVFNDEGSDWDDQFSLVLIARLLDRSKDLVKLRIYNPSRTFDLHTSEIKSLWRVIEWKELLAAHPII